MGKTHKERKKIKKKLSTNPMIESCASISSMIPKNEGNLNKITLNLMFENKKNSGILYIFSVAFVTFFFFF